MTTTFANTQQTSEPTAALSTRPRSNLRTPASSSIIADYKKVANHDPHAALQEQLQDDRFSEMRADLAGQYIENLAIPSRGDMAVPGFKLVPVALAREFGLAGLGEGGENDDPLGDIDFDEDTTEPVGAVDGNHVPTFVEGIKGQHLFDVLNGTLLAQLAANARFHRAEDPVGWTTYYGSVLENIGWVVPDFQFRGLRSHETRFSMDDAIIKVITGIMTQNQVEVVQAALEALQSLNGEDRRLQIFRRNSVSTNDGNFQISSVGESAAGILSMQLCAFGFSTDEAVTDVLWFRFNSGSTSLRATRTTLVLNDQVYDRIRDAVLDKLGNRGLNFIGGLDLAEN